MSDLKQRKEVVGFIGAGNMAAALVKGLVSGGLAPKQILVSDLDTTKSEALSQQLGVVALKSEPLVEQADVVVLAVKPAGVPGVAKSHAALGKDKLWVSIAAGVTCQTIEEALGGEARVVRAMPNTPALVGEGATGIAQGAHATDADVETAQALLNAVGITEVVAESMMDAVTGLSGSGPAFIMLVIESMTDGAVRAGLPRPIAQKLATQTVLGSAALQKETGTHPGQLKDMVTSPGGTTIAGVEALEAAGLRTAMISAVNAAFRRSKELSEK